VRQGDTLWDIAKLYDGVSVDQIKTLNNINNSKKLKPGQKLKVAVKS
jgi:membrane-bound lytic murein transglycosylase D